MQMNKGLLSLWVACVMLLGSTGTVLAADTEARAEIEAQVKAAAGVTPDSKLYGLDLAMEQLLLSLTRAEAKLAEMEAEIAAERAAEAAVMAGKGKHELAGKAAAESGVMLTGAAEHLEVAAEKSAISATALGRLKQAEEASLLALEIVLEKTPERDRPALEKVLARQKETARAAVEVALEAARSDGKESESLLKQAADALGRVEIRLNGKAEVRGEE